MAVVGLLPSDLVIQLYLPIAVEVVVEASVDVVEVVEALNLVVPAAAQLQQWEVKRHVRSSAVELPALPQVLFANLLQQNPLE
jgi:hypothetical protein